MFSFYSLLISYLIPIYSYLYVAYLTLDDFLRESSTVFTNNMSAICLSFVEFSLVASFFSCFLVN